jgi:Uma2 family endonuclease
MNPRETSPIDLPPAVVPPSAGGPQLVLRPEDYPNVENLVTEDGAPVDSVYAEKQQRLLTEPLYASWHFPEGEQRFVALSNVGLFSTTERPPLVPDCLLSLEVEFPREIRRKEHHSYFFWLYGKPPDAVIEIVSDRRGGEEDYKMSEYARMRVPYYAIYDPNNHLGGGELRVLELQRRRYRAVADNWMEGVGLGLKLWQGIYEGVEETWLRWSDRDGRVILTGRELAEQERQRADEVSERIKRLEAQLRAQGMEPSA